MNQPFSFYGPGSSLTHQKMTGPSSASNPNPIFLETPSVQLMDVSSYSCNDWLSDYLATNSFTNGEEGLPTPSTSCGGNEIYADNNSFLKEWNLGGVLFITLQLFLYNIIVKFQEYPSLKIDCDTFFNFAKKIFNVNTLYTT